jgi:hypothetical protein
MTEKKTRLETNSDLIAPPTFRQTDFFENDVNVKEDSSTFQYYFKVNAK